LLLFLWIFEYAKNRGNLFLVGFFLFTVVSMYLMVRFAPLQRSG